MMINQGDAVHEAEDVTAMVLIGSSDADIIVSCDAVEYFLRRHSKEQTRHFNTVGIAVPFSRSFGFDDLFYKECVAHPPYVSEPVGRLFSPQEDFRYNKIKFAQNQHFTFHRMSLSRFSMYFWNQAAV